MATELFELNGPIPGANFTTDERNYPWHRPPDITDTDDAIDYIAEKMTGDNVGFRYMTMIEMGISIAAVTDMLITLGIADGKWTPDFAILIAGPTARLLEIMAKSYGITEYEMGLDNNAPEPTAAFAKALAEQDELEAEAMEENAPEDTEGGLMTMPDQAEQDMMLGYGTEDEAESE